MRIVRRLCFNTFRNELAAQPPWCPTFLTSVQIPWHQRNPICSQRRSEISSPISCQLHDHRLVPIKWHRAAESHIQQREYLQPVRTTILQLTSVKMDTSMIIQSLSCSAKISTASTNTMVGWIPRWNVYKAEQNQKQPNPRYAAYISEIMDTFKDFTYTHMNIKKWY